MTETNNGNGNELIFTTEGSLVIKESEYIYMVGLYAPELKIRLTKYFFKDIEKAKYHRDGLNCDIKDGEAKYDITKIELSDNLNVIYF